MQKGNKRSLEKEVKEEGRGRMGGGKREMNVCAPVALLGLQYLKPHLTVIARREMSQVAAS